MADYKKDIQDLAGVYGWHIQRIQCNGSQIFVVNEAKFKMQIQIHKDDSIDIGAKLLGRFIWKRNVSLSYYESVLNDHKNFTKK